jgi:predicted metal-dependent enzyme (double-stranded beta helix superfamily)
MACLNKNASVLVEDLAAKGLIELLLYVDQEYEFALNAVVRMPGRKGSIHDHANAWVLYGVLDGTESLERYERQDDESRKDCVEVRLASVTTGSQGKVDLVAPFEIHAEQGGPTRSVAMILRSQRLGQGTVLQNTYDMEKKTVIQQYGPTQIPFNLLAETSAEDQSSAERHAH